MTLSAPYRSTRHRKASNAGSQTDSSDSDRSEDCPHAHLNRGLVLTPGAAMPGVGCMIRNSRKTKRYASLAMAVGLSPSGCRTNALGAWMTAYKDMLRNTRRVVMMGRKKGAQFPCRECMCDTTLTTCIRCDHCYSWLHTSCIGMRDEVLRQFDGDHRIFLCAECAMDNNGG